MQILPNASPSNPLMQHLPFLLKFTFCLTLIITLVVALYFVCFDELQTEEVKLSTKKQQDGNDLKPNQGRTRSRKSSLSKTPTLRPILESSQEDLSLDFSEVPNHFNLDNLVNNYTVRRYQYEQNRRSSTGSTKFGNDSRFRDLGKTRFMKMGIKT